MGQTLVRRILAALRWWLRREGTAVPRQSGAPQLPSAAAGNAMSDGPDESAPVSPSGPYRSANVRPAEAPGPRALDELIVEKGIEFCRNVVRHGAQRLRAPAPWNDGPVHEAARAVGFGQSLALAQAVPVSANPAGWRDHRCVTTLRDLHTWAWALIVLDEERRDALVVHFATLPGAELRDGPAFGPFRTRNHEGVHTWTISSPCFEISCSPWRHPRSASHWARQQPLTCDRSH
jgi:hypothetical protein